ncbi:MAG: hypothetical protein ACTHK6_02620 [Solirubrobacterales bacterium]
MVAWLALIPPADAELTAKGDLFVRFGGGISPHALPRSEPAPVAVRIEGSIRTARRQEPPPLRGIRIELNRGGRVDVAGLPTCTRPQVTGATLAQALEACGPALVGTGGFGGMASFPEQALAPVRGEILLFNSRTGGGPGVLGYVNQSYPVDFSRVVAFHIHRAAPPYGESITARVPPAVNRNGYLTSLYLQLRRRYLYRGRMRSYLSASCAAPPGFDAALFPLAKVSMWFADGRTLTSTLVRSCAVR